MSDPLSASEYLLAENRVFRRHVRNRIHLIGSECISLAKAAKPLGRLLLAEIASIGSRKVQIARFTPNPNRQWMQQIARNITMTDIGFANGMKYLIRDHDSKIAEEFQEAFESAGTRGLFGHTFYVSKS